MDSLIDLRGLRVGAEAFLAAMLRATAQPVLVLDSEGVIRFANAAAAAALGYDGAGEIVGRPGRDIAGSQHPTLIPRTTGEAVASELARFVRGDGSMLPVSYVSVPLDLPDGRGAVVAFTEMGGLQRAEQVLVDRERALANEQASLRRVAALAAEGASCAEVFAAVAQELADAGTGRRGPEDPAPGEGRGPHGRPADDQQGPLRRRPPCWSRPPIVMEGRQSGGAGAPAPAATEVSDGHAQEDLHRLVEEQAALRRVATLVAEGVTTAEVFAAVAAEIGRVLKLPVVEMFRYDADDAATVVGSSGEHPFRPGTRWTLDGLSLASMVRRTGRPARLDDYMDGSGTIREAARSAGVEAAVAAPIVVDGELWGAVVAGADRPEPLQPDAERRLSRFTALLATAFSSSQAREDLSRLAHEQAALRRLATLVAQGAEPRAVFDAVCEETGRVLGASSMRLDQFTSDGFGVTVAAWSTGEAHVPAGTRLALEDDSLGSLVLATAAPGRFDGYDTASGELADVMRRLGIRSEVGVPVVVEGRVWGGLIAGRAGQDPLPAGTEHRLASFAEPIATALSNAAARSELLESRVRIVEAADEQRRRVVRDLHDGAQSRLVHAIIALERAEAHDGTPPEVRLLVEEGLTHARSAIDELRELAHGIHPALLTRGGLAAAIDALAQRAALPVELAIPDERYPTPVESAAYFVAAEALTNIAKHARASTARITVTRMPAGLRLVVEDDGAGGARRAPGGGLGGLADRLAALDGVLSVDSPPGAGTRITAEIPLPAQD